MLGHSRIQHGLGTKKAQEIGKKVEMLQALQ